MHKNKFENLKLPKIVLKDRFGVKLRTETTYQNQIAYERLKLKQNLPDLDDSNRSFEWRLPEAPVPSKPDYSRVKYQYNIKNRYYSFHQPTWLDEYKTMLKHKKILKYLDLSAYDFYVSTKEKKTRLR
jgi:hypothetical protein